METKFRAWFNSEMHDEIVLIDYQYCKVEKGLGCPLNAGIKDFLSHDDPDSPMILMQYIDQKDKNGVEIYEGDVVKLFMVRKGKMSIYWESCEVFFRNGRWNAGWPKGQGKDLWSWTIDPDAYAVEVIGNIYENPGLLKNEG